MTRGYDSKGMTHVTSRLEDTDSKKRVAYQLQETTSNARTLHKEVLFINAAKME